MTHDQEKALQESGAFRREMKNQGILVEALVPKESWRKYQSIRKAKRGIIEIHPVTVSRIEQRAADSVAAVLYLAQAKTLEGIKARTQAPSGKMRSVLVKLD